MGEEERPERADRSGRELTDEQVAAMRKELHNQLWTLMAEMKESMSKAWSLVERMEALR